MNYTPFAFLFESWRILLFWPPHPPVPLLRVCLWVSGEVLVSVDVMWRCFLWQGCLLLITAYPSARPPQSRGGRGQRERGGRESVRVWDVERELETEGRERRKQREVKKVPQLHLPNPNQPQPLTNNCIVETVGQSKPGLSSPPHPVALMNRQNHPHRQWFTDAKLESNAIPTLWETQPLSILTVIWQIPIEGFCSHYYLSFFASIIMGTDVMWSKGTWA